MRPQIQINPKLCEKYNMTRVTKYRGKSLQPLWDSDVKL